MRSFPQRTDLQPSANVSSLIQHKRLQKGLSARALSQRAGQSDSYVSKLEAGSVEPSLKTFSRLAVALQLTPLEVWAIVACEGAQ